MIFGVNFFDRRNVRTKMDDRRSFLVVALLGCLSNVFSEKNFDSLLSGSFL